MSLQCGHGSDAVENSATVSVFFRLAMGFNAATAVTPWRTSTAPSPRCRASRSFNAATAVTPWRTKPIAGRRKRRPESFNAATAVTPWRTVVSVNSAIAAGVLQCGHGSDAVENSLAMRPVFFHPELGFNAATAVTPWRTRGLLDLRVERQHASMRPRQ